MINGRAADGLAGNAKIEGMGKDLKLTGYQYNIALSIFFVTYITCGMPRSASLLVHLISHAKLLLEKRSPAMLFSPRSSGPRSTSASWSSVGERS